MAKWENFYDRVPSSNGGYISMLEGLSKNYMDPNSSYNNRMLGMVRQAGKDSIAQQNQAGMKLAAAGQNPFADTQYQSGLSNNVDDSYNAMTGVIGQGQQMGMSMLDMANRTRMQQSQQTQQQSLADREYKQHERGQWIGLGGTLLSAGIMGPLAAMVTKPTSIVNNMPEGVSELSTLMFSGDPVGASINDYISEKGYKTSDLGDARTPQYADVLDKFGEQATTSFLDKAWQQGRIPSSYSTGDYWQQDPIVGPNAVAPKQASDTEWTPQQEQKFRTYMAKNWVPQAMNYDINRLINQYKIWNKGNFQWSNW